MSLAPKHISVPVSPLTSTPPAATTAGPPAPSPSRQKDLLNVCGVTPPAKRPSHPPQSTEVRVISTPPSQLPGALASFLFLQLSLLGLRPPPRERWFLLSSPRAAAPAHTEHWPRHCRKRHPFTACLLTWQQVRFMRARPVMLAWMHLQHPEQSWHTGGA